MGRPKRIDPLGFLTCTACQVPKHIRHFYTSGPKTYFTDPDDGTEYGTPTAWCRECFRSKQNAKNRTPVDDEEMADLAYVVEELAKQGLEIGGKNRDGTYYVIPLQKRSRG